jgi:hypothetical protein
MQRNISERKVELRNEVNFDVLYTIYCDLGQFTLIIREVVRSSSLFDKFRAHLMRLLQSDWLNVFSMISSEGMVGF